MGEFEVSLYVSLAGTCLVLGAALYRQRHITRNACKVLGHSPLREWQEETECLMCGKKMYKDYSQYTGWTTEKKRK